MIPSIQSIMSDSILSNEEASRGIYKISAPSGGTYIGMTTKSFKERWSGHLKELRNGRHKCQGLRRAYAKYGLALLVFQIVEVLDSSTEQEILLREQFWWDHLKSEGVNLYNGRPTGTGSVTHTDESKKMISDSIRAMNIFNGNVEERFCANCNKAFHIASSRPKKFCTKLCSEISQRRSGLDSSLIRILYLEGSSIAKIAQKLNVSKSAIARQLSRDGVEMRKNRHP